MDTDLGLESAGGMNFWDYIGVEVIGCVLALLVVIQLGWELRSIYLSDLASRGGVFLQVQGRIHQGRSRSEPLDT